MAEHWYAATALEDLLGIPDAEVTKDRLYRTLDGLRAAQQAIEDDLKKHLETLFDLHYDLLLYDITSTTFTLKDWPRAMSWRPMATRGTIARTASKWCWLWW